MNLLPFFPEKVFDGTFSGRPNLSDVRPPGYHDYMKLAKEIEHTQRFILENFENLQSSPDLLGFFRDLEAKSEKINEKLENITPPDDLLAYIKDVERKTAVLDDRIHTLQRSLARAELSIGDLADRLETIESSWANDVTAFQRHNRGEYSRLKESVAAEIDDLRDRIKRLKDIF